LIAGPRRDRYMVCRANHPSLNANKMDDLAEAERLAAIEDLA
jgi:hypothetical protein